MLFMLYQRVLNLPLLLKKKSFFLFGPRSTGKTTLLREQFKNAQVYDLLDDEIYRRLLKRPKLIEEEWSPKRPLVIIDEIQKLPGLLDEVHRLIESKNIKFLLTGSSARKLRRGSVNLLAGRAWEARLFPLTSREIPGFELLQYLNRGGLPHVYSSSDYEEELLSYTNTYLREEIRAEALTRNVQAFSEFLDAIALSNGEEINFESLARDCQISTSTIKNYLSILSDTLLGFSLPGFTKTKKRKAISRAKFYLFDLGVTNTLCQRGQIKPKSELFGKAFEHFIILETKAALSYKRSPQELAYWRSTSQFEVDLLIGRDWAIEIKGTEIVQDHHLNGLRALKEEKLFKKHFIVSLDKTPRKTSDGIEILPWRIYLDRLWNNELKN